MTPTHHFTLTFVAYLTVENEFLEEPWITLVQLHTSRNLSGYEPVAVGTVLPVLRVIAVDLVINLVFGRRGHSLHGGQRLEAVLGGEARFRIYVEIPIIGKIIVVMCVAEIRVVGVLGYVTLFYRLQAVRRTGYKVASVGIQPFDYRLDRVDV